MSGVTVLLRRRARDNRRPFDHRTKASKAEAARACALSILSFQPPLDDEAIENANALLEMVGDMLTAPRAGWYPQRPKGWHA